MQLSQTDPASAGKKIASQPGSVEERIASHFRRCLTRHPTADETALLAKFFATQKARFLSHELDAKAIAGDGPGDVSERAAWTGNGVAGCGCKAGNGSRIMFGE